MNIGSKLSLLLTHNWREKLVAIALAFLVWYLIKSQRVVGNSGPWREGPPLIYDRPPPLPPSQL